MTHAISEYAYDLWEGINQDRSQDDTTTWQPVRFFITGRWADAVWNTVQLTCHEDNDVKIERVDSENDAHVVIETHDRLSFDMALCDSRYFDEYVGTGKRKRTVKREMSVHDCICEIAEFTRYKIRPKVAEAMLHVINLWRTREDHPYPQPAFDTPEEVYVKRENPRGTLGASWVDVLPDSWVRAYTMIMMERLRADGIRRVTNDSLEYIRHQLYEDPWINHYTDHLTKKEWRAVFTGVKMELKRERKDDDFSGSGTTPSAISPGWLGLREMIHSLCIEKGMSERDSKISSWYAVPPLSKMNKVETREALIDADEIQHIKRPAFNAILKRKLFNKDVITPSDIGRVGEEWLLSVLNASLEPLENGVIEKDREQTEQANTKRPSRIDSLRAHRGPGTSGVCDISDRADGDPEAAGWALNVKLSLEEEVNRSFEVSPEHQVKRSWVLLLLPRRLQMRLYPITDESMTINSDSGGLCVKPEELAETVKRLISGELTI